MATETLTPHYRSFNDLRYSSARVINDFWKRNKALCLLSSSNTIYTEQNTKLTNSIRKGLLANANALDFLTAILNALLVNAISRSPLSKGNTDQATPEKFKVAILDFLNFLHNENATSASSFEEQKIRDLLAFFPGVAAYVKVNGNSKSSITPTADEAGYFCSDHTVSTDDLAASATAILDSSASSLSLPVCATAEKDDILFRNTSGKNLLSEKEKYEVRDAIQAAYYLKTDNNTSHKDTLDKILLKKTANKAERYFSDLPKKNLFVSPSSSPLPKRRHMGQSTSSENNITKLLRNPKISYLLKLIENKLSSLNDRDDILGCQKKRGLLKIREVISNEKLSDTDKFVEIVSIEMQFPLLREAFYHSKTADIIDECKLYLNPNFKKVIKNKQLPIEYYVNINQTEKNNDLYTTHLLPPNITKEIDLAVYKLSLQLESGVVGGRLQRSMSITLGLEESLLKPIGFSNNGPLFDNITFELRKYLEHRNNISSVLSKLETARNGYELCLISKLPQGNREKVEPGKIYISNNGNYVVRDPQGNLQEGSLKEMKAGKPEQKSINLTNLHKKLEDPEFKKQVLSITYKNGHTYEYIEPRRLEALRRIHIYLSLLNPDNLRFKADEPITWEKLLDKAGNKDIILGEGLYKWFGISSAVEIFKSVARELNLQRNSFFAEKSISSKDNFTAAEKVLEDCAPPPAEKVTSCFSFWGG